MDMSSLGSFFFFFSFLLLTHGGAAEVTLCGGDDALVRGQPDFVLDTRDAVDAGAVLVATTRVNATDGCARACCENARCNLALLKPASGGDVQEEGRACVLFNCVHRNKFVCRFVNQNGYETFIRKSTFRRYLRGPGDKAPPISIPGCNVVVQPGRTVTLNGSESLAMFDAKIISYDWMLQSGDDGVTMETDFEDQLRLSNLRHGSYVFQLTVTDSSGQSGVANVTVLVLGPEDTGKYCLAKMKVGPCRAAFRRWRYNVTMGQCEEFVFGGCKENKNNYLSKEHCLSACGGVTASSGRIITEPAAEVCGSPCGPNQLTCSSSCCVDWIVECDGIRNCGDGSDEHHCSQLNQTFSNLLDIDVNQKKAQCTEPPMTGPCRASFPRWYYDPLNQKCFSFTFGGCNGNQNNFEEEENCREECRGVTESHVYARGLFDRFEKDEENSNSGTIALAVVLSVAILSLLAIFGYCFLKRRRDRAARRRAAHQGPTHPESPEEDALVYNPTTKPLWLSWQNYHFKPSVWVFNTASQ
ncbi:kunitz-type protease inhibitor 1-like isoform 2-T2 [Pholidichthys leucotaenia]